MTARIGWLLGVLVCAAACAPADPIAVDNAWLRPPAPGLDIAAGYFDIANRRDRAVDLIGARSAAAGTIEMHSHAHDGALMQMRRLERVTLPPGERVSFNPGGTHLMLFGFNGAPGNGVPITLLFSDGGQVTVTFQMRTLSGENPP